MLPLFALLPLLASASALTSHKAASPLTNLGCQCSSLTFVDSAGQVPSYMYPLFDCFQHSLTP